MFHFLSFIISLYSPTFSIFLLILAELIFLAIFDNAWVDLIFIFCSWGWENARERPHFDEAYSLSISAWYKSPLLLSTAISPRAIGHHFIQIFIVGYQKVLFRSLPPQGWLSLKKSLKLTKRNIIRAWGARDLEMNFDIEVCFVLMSGWKLFTELSKILIPTEFCRARNACLIDILDRYARNLVGIFGAFLVPYHMGKS